MVKPPRVRESAFSMECEVRLPAQSPSPGRDWRPQLLQSIDIFPPTCANRNRQAHPRAARHARCARGCGPGQVSPRRTAGRHLLQYALVGDMFRLPRYLWEEEREGVERF
ncbi:hypothetical protein CALCODRAFT_498327 [Calocera cornea HHB12733]|uniref:Uncharacterized protein n=1 Tax=Calocera cornea HHB12733 TaxID=1353952 RepID=A0A165EXG7_9BASI|nr:hypothetical protein CALCODRAFT_498327 [Calocera cornea HHB12733]